MLNKKFGFILSGIIIAGLNAPIAFALTDDDTTNSQYLLNNGYSPESVRVFEVQKNQISGTPDIEKKPNLVIKFMKNLIIHSDPIEPLHNFGNTPFNNFNTP